MGIGPSGSGQVSILGPPVPLNTWCLVTLTRLAQSITMTVHEDVMAQDEGDVVTGSIGGGSTGLTVGGVAWIGGALGEMIQDAGFTNSFSGCIHKVQVS